MAGMSNTPGMNMAGMTNMGTANVATGTQTATRGATGAAAASGGGGMGGMDMAMVGSTALPYVIPPPGSKTSR